MTAQPIDDKYRIPPEKQARLEARKKMLQQQAALISRGFSAAEIYAILDCLKVGEGSDSDNDDHPL